jgi:KaiC/GvpD/RAD55 family RecA-like ATPase
VTVFSSPYSSLATSYTQQIIDVTGSFSSLPGTVSIALFLDFTGHVKVSGFNGYVYFDNVYLYVNCTVPPQSTALKMNEAAISGQQYGTGSVHLHGALTAPFIFTSNTTGRIRFKCNSTIAVYRAKLSDLVTFIATQGLTVNNNVSKATFFNASPWTLGSTIYTQDVLNVSIPHSWLYSGVVFPNGGGVSGESPGRVKKYDNGSSWIIKINATSIGSYGPNPYVVQATSTNHLGVVSTFRKMTGGWVPADVFVNGSRIMINATVQGGISSQGSAYVVFYNSSDSSTWRNMSAYALTPGSNGVVSFDFAWSNTNVTKSNLAALVLWKNSTEVSVSWIPISFDLSAPKVGIAMPYSNQYAGGVTEVTVWNQDAHPRNITLFINGKWNGTWTTPSAVYSWDTTVFAEGPVELKVTGWDEFDHTNTTAFMVTVDNTNPSLTANLPAPGSYVRGQVPLTSSCTDAHLKNLTLYIDGRYVTGSTFGDFIYPWNTPAGEGSAVLTVKVWDLAGNLNETSSTVYFDNILPTPDITLPLAGSKYARGIPKIDISCIETHFKNVTLYIDGVANGTWTYVNPSCYWNTSAWGDGARTLNATAWDLAGNKGTKVISIYVDNTAPAKPALWYPNDGDVFNSTTLGVPLQWVSVVDTGSGLNHYILQLDTSQSFDSSNLRTIGYNSSTSYWIDSSSPLSGGIWYWRVAAVDNATNMGEYSGWRSFQVLVGPPPEGLPIALLVGFGSVAAVAVLSSVILMKRRKAEPEEYDRRNLMVAYVFSRDGRAMFEHQFKEVKVEPQLVSGFLTAISEMMKEVIGGDKRPLRTIERSDAKILIEFGTIVTGALVAKKSSREYRRRLKAFINRFEDDYADKLVKWNGDQSIFQAAPEVIEEAFSDKTKVTTHPTITGLEDLLFSEKLSGVAVSVQGKTGSGKTEFCLRYASSLLKKGKPIIVVANSLTPKDAREGLTNNDVDVDKAEKAGRLIIYDAYSEASGIHSSEKYKFGSPGELNNMNIALSKNLSGLKNATVIFDSLSAMIDYSELELVADFIRTFKAKISQGGHTAFFIIDSNAHSKDQLNYILSTMDGEIETITETTRKGEPERLVSFKRLKGVKVRPGYHEFK